MNRRAGAEFDGSGREQYALGYGIVLTIAACDRPACDRVARDNAFGIIDT